jgi:hypothetical protein
MLEDWDDPWEARKAWQPVTELATALLQYTTVPGRLVDQILKDS